MARVLRSENAGNTLDACVFVVCDRPFIVTVEH